ncbi:MAG: 5-dehydro-2-deoxygluconokinase [Oscillospiraceae bacterium]|nr:5-dehydro-2-deoxygluconokinase [Oscillospiraceae bacterium]
MSMIYFDDNRPFDVILLGRIALDINPADFSKSFIDNTEFQKFVGGSAANTGVGLAKMGMKVGFISCVSDDSLGDYVLHFLNQYGIDTSKVSRAPKGVMLGLAFSEILPGGKTNLMMYRDENVADLHLTPDDVDENYIASAKCLVVSGTALSASPSREAALKAIMLAKKHGTKIVFDIDYRPQVWKSKNEISIYYTLAAKDADIIMGSREEFDLTDYILTDSRDDDETAKRWFAEKASLLIIKHGSEGSYVFTNDGKKYKVLPFKISFLKATGGGDAYSSAFLSAMLKGLSVPECAERGTASASLAVAATNCSEALPTEEQLVAFIQKSRAEGQQVIHEIK